MPPSEASLCVILRSRSAVDWLSGRGLTASGSPDLVVDEQRLDGLRIARIWHGPVGGSFSAPADSTVLFLQLDAAITLMPAPIAPHGASRLRIASGDSFALAAGQAVGVLSDSASARIETELDADGEFALPGEDTPALFWTAIEEDWARPALISLTNSVLNVEREVEPTDVPRLVEAFRSVASTFLARSTIARPLLVESWSEAIVERARRVIRRRGADPSFSVGRLADELGITPTHLSRAFRVEGVDTPGRALRAFRRDLALALREEHAASARRLDAAEWARRSGFGSADSLRRAVRERSVP